MPEAQGGHGPRADGRGRAGEGDGRLRRRAVRHPVLHHHHRVGPGHPARQHHDRQPRRPLRAGPALPAARAHRPLAGAGVLLPGGAGRGGAVGRGQAAAGGAAAVHRAGRRLPGGHPRPGDPRRGRSAGRAAARAGGGGRASTPTCSILEEAVAELRGQPIKREHDPEISVDVPAFLPDDYIPDTGQRLELYRRLAQARDEDEVRAIAGRDRRPLRPAARGGDAAGRGDGPEDAGAPAGRRRLRAVGHPAGGWLRRRTPPCSRPR